jgi:membrane fusion protein (multidrug efflux system)
LIAVPLPMPALHSVRRFAALCITAACLPLAALADLAALDGIVLPFKEVVVSSPVQSTIVAITVREGDSVKSGQQIAQLYSRSEELDLGRAKAILQKRIFDHRGAKRLFDDKIVPEDKELEARIELELAQLQHDIAAENVRIRAIASPLDGIVVERLREAGESVTASQPLFRIIDISRVYVQFFIRAEELSRFTTGQKLAARFDALKDSPTFYGQVDFIDPRVDASSGLLRVRLLIDNPGHVIKAGMRAMVDATAK